MFKNLPNNLIIRIVFLVCLVLYCGGISAQGIISSVSPNLAFTNSTGSFKIACVVDTDSIAVNGAIKLRSIKGFGVPQLFSGSQPNYVKATCSRPGVTLTSEAKTRSDTLVPWDVDYNAYILTFRVKNKVVYQGDTIFIIYGNTTTAGAMATPKFAMLDSFRIAYSITGASPYVNVKNAPCINVRSGSPSTIQAFLPSTIIKGDTARAKIVVTDMRYNRAVFFTGRVLISCSDSTAVYPSYVDLVPADSGRSVINVVFNSTGPQTIVTTVENATPASSWTKRSNPVLVQDSSNGTYLYWGDLHSHSSISHDGSGTGNFEYAEKVSCLDFFSLTEHCSASLFSRQSGINNDELSYIKNSNINYYKPGKFVTIFGYEYTAAGINGGHHNVFFRANNAEISSVPLAKMMTYKTVRRLWQQKDSLLQGYEYFTVPHHTGIGFNTGTPPTVTMDGTYKDSVMRPLVEIYSDHGLSESYDPVHPLSYEKLSDGDSYSVNGAHYAQDGWVNDEYLGTIAAGDNHEGMAGISGLTAVYAPSLTREAIYDALKSKHTYGTTGKRIIVDFRINQSVMGSSIYAAPSDYNKIDLEVYATANIQFIEVLKWSGEMQNGHPVFKSIYKELNPGVSAKRTIADCNDFSLSDISIYYFRVKENDSLFNNHAEKFVESWAWSSPIWVKKCDTCLVAGLPVQLNLNSTDSSICSGNQVEFTVMPDLLIKGGVFQWFLNGSLIDGVATTTYISDSLQNNDRISVAYLTDSNCISTGSIYSDTIDIEVRQYPSFNIHPVSDTICFGGSHSFNVQGDNILSYQWQHKKVTDTAWVSLPGNSKVLNTTTPSITLNAVGDWMDGNLYRCIGTNTCGSVISDSAKFLVSGYPESRTETLLNNDKVILKWQPEPYATSYKLAYKKTSDLNWKVKTLNQGSDSLLLRTLTTGDYHWKIKSLCSGTSWSNYSPVRVFSIGCGVPALLPCDSTTNNSMIIKWRPVPTALKYEVGYRRIDSSWIYGNITTDTALAINNLTSGATYVYFVRSRCASTWTDFSLPGTVTLGSSKFFGISDSSQVENLMINPNPFSGSISLSFEYDSDEDIVVELYDAQGRKVRNTFAKDIGRYSAIINTSDLSNGIYLLKIIADDGISVHRLIKQ